MKERRRRGRGEKKDFMDPCVELGENSFNAICRVLENPLRSSFEYKMSYIRYKLKNVGVSNFA
jgi:hypothetical protein